MTSKECELQLNQLIIDWDEDRATRLNATDIEAIKHLMLENQMQHNTIVALKQEKQLLNRKVDYLEDKNIPFVKELMEDNQQLKDRINKAIEYMEQWGKEPDADMYIKMKDYNEFKYLLKILKEDNKEEN